VNDSAVKVLGEPTLKDIARELVAHVRKNVTIDWTLRESAQAHIRVLVRRRHLTSNQHIPLITGNNGKEKVRFGASSCILSRNIKE
jgi:hypothetical protein